MTTMMLMMSTGKIITSTLAAQIQEEGATANRQKRRAAVLRWSLCLLVQPFCFVARADTSSLWQLSAGL